MPFYEYQCAQCEHHLEVLQKITDKPLRKCPACGKSALKKLMSAPVFRLKGSGWYETDFKSDNEAKRNLVGADKEETKSTEKDAPEKTSDAKASDTKAAGEKSDTGNKAKPDSAKAETSKGTERSQAGKAGDSKPKTNKRSVSSKRSVAQRKPAKPVKSAKRAR